MWHNKFYSDKSGKWRYFYEPLNVSIPPDECRPYCYGIDRIAFYKEPQETREEGYAKWVDIQTEYNLLGHKWTDEDLGWSSLVPIVEHDGAFWLLVSGEVIYSDGWFMRWRSGPIEKTDHRLIGMRQRDMEGSNEYCY